ncbi:mucin-6-like [Thamnophis elegans]|uniref:mucin-6-like n=1 Tax=Thamnophis elegans TaxID=35005 RepID=UPI0013789041|nr:mucin-6-like [Thamnophis elegans]
MTTDSNPTMHCYYLYFLSLAASTHEMSTSHRTPTFSSISPSSTLRTTESTQTATTPMPKTTTETSPVTPPTSSSTKPTPSSTPISTTISSTSPITLTSSTTRTSLPPTSKVISTIIPISPSSHAIPPTTITPTTSMPSSPTGSTQPTSTRTTSMQPPTTSMATAIKSTSGKLKCLVWQLCQLYCSDVALRTSQMLCLQPSHVIPPTTITPTTSMPSSPTGSTQPTSTRTTSMQPPTTSMATAIKSTSGICSTIEYEEQVFYKGCVSNVTLTRCEGACPSSTSFLIHRQKNARIEKLCKCCTPTTSYKKEIEMPCPNPDNPNEPLSIYILIFGECVCNVEECVH